jgi:2-haloacid dehalogenase
MPIRVVVFDVNETLSDMSPLAERFVEIGTPAHLARAWFASLLRDGFALTSLGEIAPFSELGREGLLLLLQDQPSVTDPDAATAHVMSGFAELGLHPDVEPGIRELHEDGVRLVTLSNGAAAVAERLLSRADLSGCFEHLLSVEDVGIWKPAARAYEHAARTCGVAADELLMVAVHPWDLHGAARAGLRTAWINRDGRRYPAYFRAPDHVVTGVGDLVEVVAG